MEEKVTLVLDYMNEVKTRCTYNAAAKALGITTTTLKKQLGERRPEISWFVGTESGPHWRNPGSLQ